jgi:hypothetical protein
MLTGKLLLLATYGVGGWRLLPEVRSHAAGVWMRIRHVAQGTEAQATG